MNSERLRATVDQLLDVERRFGIQGILQQLMNEMQQLIQNPGHQQFQTQYAATLQSLKRKWAEMAAAFSPAERKIIAEVKGEPFFLDGLPDEVEAIARDNPLTPAVTQQKIHEVFSRRQDYLAALGELQNRMKVLGIEAYPLESGQAEIGFLLPRELFHNHLDALVVELGVINKVIRAVAEAATGSAEPIEVHQISTSDPIFFFGMSAATVAALGAVVKWALDTWKTVEEIRKLRSETKKNAAFSEEEIKAFFDNKIKATIDAAIEAKVTDLIGDGRDHGRLQEQRNYLNWALESVLTRVERGMAIEVRFLPPPPAKTAAGEPAPEPAEYETLREIVPQLTFPAPDPSPILTLPPAEPPKVKKQDK